MYTLIAQNKYGQQLELTNNNAYSIKSIDGLDPPDSVINTTRNAYADGSVFNSSYIDDRTITITLAINSPAEDNRINLYKYFKTKFPIRLYYSNDTRNVYIDGYVKSMNISFFEKKQVAQIVVFCPKPLFNGVENQIISFSAVGSLFEFPFSVEEAGNVLTITGKSTTINGLTFTVDSPTKGGITVNGKATAITSFWINQTLGLEAGSYILSGCPNGGSVNTYQLNYNNGVAQDNGSGAPMNISASDTSQTLRIRINNSVVCDNLVFYPQIKPNTPAEGIEFSDLLIGMDKNIFNGGDIETGIIIKLRAIGPVINPTIYNTETNEYLTLTVSMSQGDEIVINTRNTEKSITMNTFDGTQKNLIGALKDGSTWFQLVPGDNLYTTTAEGNPQNLESYCIIQDQFEGV